MSVIPDPIDVRRYDAVVEQLRQNQGANFEDVALRCKVAVSTVKKIWDGRISRPPVVVIERLSAPRRCPQCGARCLEWPCILCEMKRRTSAEGGQLTSRPLRFKYKTQSK
jgi:hypothetical protein